MHGAQIKRDTRWGAGEPACDRRSADAKDEGCSAAAPDLQAELTRGPAWGTTIGHWSFPYQVVGELLLLAREE